MSRPPPVRVAVRGRKVLGVTRRVRGSAGRRRRQLSGLAALVLLATTTTACGDDQGDEVKAAATAYAKAWSAGNDAGAARHTDAPKAAAALLGQVRESLAVTRVRAVVGAVPEPEEGRSRVPVRVTMQLRGLGDWTYNTDLSLRETGEGDNARWLVHWTPKTVHPKLTAATRLGRSRSLPERAPVLDRDGQPLMTEQPVVDIGVEPRRLTQPARAYAALARVGVDPAALRARVQAAPPDQFVPAITLRDTAFGKVEERLRALPGLVFREDTLTLAPTATYARALLGTVRPATKETLEKAGPLTSAADTVGASGLQAAFQEQLAGDPSGEVRLVRISDEEVVSLVHTFPGETGTPLATTIDRGVQDAAERALAKAPGPAALVAVQPSSGEVLAVANAPADSTFDRAVAGRYAPGSTFKVVSAAALFTAGLSPSDVVACPSSVSVEGKTFVNYDALGALGRVPFARDFAQSCNTAFINATRELDNDALSEAAGTFGVGAEWDLGVEAFSGSVPPAASAVEQAADTIGQGKVELSPLGMAMVAAAVADGKPRSPVLLPEVTKPPAALDALPRRVGRTLHRLMLDTVSTGTASVLAMQGEPVGAKTGTAEYGEAKPPRKHAWMIGFRGDLAFAVLVEDGESGSKTAGPLARAFLQSAT